MQIKHSWTEETENGFLKQKFVYQLVVRASLTQNELDTLNKYKAMNAWLYSNRAERENQKVSPGQSGEWWEHVAAGWHNAGIEPLLEITFADLLRGISLKNENPYYLDNVFSEISKSSEAVLQNLFDLNQLFNGEENVIEIVTDPNHNSSP